MRKDKLADRIIGVLGRSKDSLNSKTIARAVKAPGGSVNKCLARMLKAGAISRESRGFYRLPGAGLVRGVPVYAELCLHGIKLEARISEVCHFRGGDSPPEGARKVAAGPKFMKIDITEGTHKHSNNGSWTCNAEFLGRIITITEAPPRNGARLIEVYLGTRGGSPLRFNEWEQFTAWLSGRFPDIPEGLWYVRQVGLNWDLPGMTLKGIEQMTLTIFKNLWLSFYNHAGRLRVEAHYNGQVELAQAAEIFASLVQQFSISTGAGLVSR